jgi:hypothetical protein
MVEEQVEVPNIAGKGAEPVSANTCEIIEPRSMKSSNRKGSRQIRLRGTLASVSCHRRRHALPGAVEMLGARSGAALGRRPWLGLLDVDKPIYAVGVGSLRHPGQERGVSCSRRQDFAKVKHRMSDWLSEFFSL